MTDCFASEVRQDVPQFLPRNQFNSLINALQQAGFEVIAPRVDQGAIVYGEITAAEDLPVGWTDQQQPGKYRLERRSDDMYFGYVVGPHSWKRYLFPPVTIMATAERSGDSWEFRTVADEMPRKRAFLGVRACELAAIRIQDEVFLNGPYTDPEYRRRRGSSFIIAVNCTQAADTCFCTSMNTGPHCTAGFDLALTEISAGFVIETGSQAGRKLLQRLPVADADARQTADAAEARQQAVEQITKHLDTTGIRDLLMDNLRHPHWNEVASRCLSCTNCTMVCPTCFCSTVKEVSDLTGDQIQRERQWDSCFNFEFSYMNGSPTRNSIMSRYRQWLTHKLSTWHDQFGTSGCVGCGRCITWCPVGIDLTEEVAALRIPATEPGSATVTENGRAPAERRSP